MKDWIGTIEPEIRDVCDFYLRWYEFRSELSDEKLAEIQASNNQKEIIKWLLLMADRISMHDLNPRKVDRIQ
jgi:hypothetical protein